MRCTGYVVIIVQTILKTLNFSCYFQDLKLQTEDSFILKIVQLEELLAVRHSVFVLGPAGTGKTQVIKTLNKTYQNQKRKPMLHDINPKAVTADELFGFINPATREWKDGEYHRGYHGSVAHWTGTNVQRSLHRIFSQQDLIRVAIFIHLNVSSMWLILCR